MGLNDVLWLDFRGSWPKKESVEWLKKIYVNLKLLAIFFVDPDPYFLPIWIRTQKKKFGSGEKWLGSATLLQTYDLADNDNLDLRKSFFLYQVFIDL